MDLHPLHRAPPTSGQQQQQIHTAQEGVEPLEYTVRRMSQEIEALKLTAQYNLAKAAKYKMRLQETDGGEEAKEYRAQIRDLKENVQAVMEKLAKKEKEHVRGVKACEQEAAEKHERYVGHIRGFKASEKEAADKLEQYKEHIRGLKANERDMVEKLEQYKSHIREQAKGMASQNGVSEYKAQIRDLLDNEQAVHAKLNRYREYVRELKARTASAEGDDRVKTAMSRQFKDAVGEREQEHARFLEVSRELAGIKEELPQVKQLLREGGAATRKLQTLTAETQERIKNLRQKLVESRTQALDGQEKIQELTATARAKEEVSNSEAAATREKLKTAVHEAHVGTQRVKACAEMLAKTHMVLHTCSEYHVANQDGGDLAAALEETTGNVASFLQTLMNSSDVDSGNTN